METVTEIRKVQISLCYKRADTHTHTNNYITP